MSDLDGYSVPGEFTYMQPQYTSPKTDSFGFDPPSHAPSMPEMRLNASTRQNNPSQFSDWAFDASESRAPQEKFSPMDLSLQSFELDRMITDKLPDVSNAVARFGALTPPRSNSASSEGAGTDVAAMSPKMGISERRKRTTKPVIKEEPSSNPPAASTTGRKRKSTRKSLAATEEQDSKRRQSLEKNRLAAAKCRVNKKEKTEQLQRESHEKGVHNAFLKEQIMRMKEEVQQMNAILLAHANCEGCKSPEDIQQHLSNLGNEFFSHHMSSLNYGDYPQMNMPEMLHMNAQPGVHPAFYAHLNGDGTLMNQSLPDFDGTADFEVHTPMHTD